MILRNIFYFVILCLSTFPAFAQVNDGFDDGNFTSNPTWSGDVSEFEVDGSNTLHLNAPAATNESYLSTPNTLLDLTTWDFKVFMDFNPSSSNRAYIYLVSDQSDLEASLNGYFVMIGNADDEISLYRQDGSSTTKIIDGTNDLVNMDPVEVWVRVTRDNDGNWELFYDLTGTDSYLSEGTALDNTYTSTNYFGVLCDYTSTRSTLFNFDDISVIASTQIDTVVVTSATTATVVFNQEVNQASAENTGNYSIDNGITINSATRDVSNNNEVDLVFNQNLTNNTYELSTSNIQDAFSSTPQTESSTFSFSYLAMALDTAITLTDSTIQVTYNQTVDETTGTNPNNYLIDNAIGNPIAAAIVENDSAKVVLEVSGSFLDGVTYNLSISNVQNKSQNSTVTDNQDFEYNEPLLIDTVIASSINELLIIFSKSLDQTSAETAGNYSINNSIGNPVSASLINTDSVLLSLSDNLEDNTYEITINDVEDSDNNSIQPNTTFSFSYLPLEVISVVVSSSNAIDITFNQALTQSSAQSLTNYTINYEVGNPDSLDYLTGSSSVTLYFNDLVNNDYELTLENLSNELGNATINGEIVTFSNEVASSFKDIIISEIFPDPNPSVALPSAEFVELFNRTNNYISLKDFTLSGGTLDSAVIGPNDYVILSSSSDSLDYAVYGDVVVVNSMPTLTNSGRLLTLQDQLGNDVDSVRYDDSWYQNNDKSDGGYTLELINQDLACSDDNNWTASNNVNGGTPGVANSVLDNSPDNTAPEITNIAALSSTQLQVTFSEPMDEGSLSAATYSISGYIITVNQVLGNGFDGVVLDLDSNLVSETIYELSVTDATDCSGNEINSSAVGFYYDTTPPQVEKVVINSTDQITVVFNEPLEESIAETESNYTVDNAIGNPTTATLDNDNSHRVRLSFDTDFPLGVAHNLAIDNLTDTLSNSMSSTQNIAFQYSQQIDTVIVVASTLVDIYFDEPIDSASASQVSFYEIEDIGSPEQAIPDEYSDSIVHLVLSTNLEDNQSLSLMIEGLLDADFNDLVTPEYFFTYDTRAPVPQQIEVNDSISLTITFNEPLDEVSSEALGNYHLDNGASPDSARLTGNALVELRFSASFVPESEHTLSIANIGDVYGNTMTTTRKLDFIYDPLPPRIDTLLQLAEDSIMIKFVEFVDEISAEENTNYILDQTINPDLVSRYDVDSTVVFLHFASNLPELIDLSVALINVEDLTGNAISDTIISTLNTLNPTVASITPVSRTQLQITFGKKMDSGLLSEVTNYSVGGLSPNSIAITDDKTVVLTLGSEFTDKTNYVLQLSNLTDDSGNMLGSSTFGFEFNDYLDAISVLNEYTIELTWEKDLLKPDVTSFTLANNSTAPIAVTRDSEDLNVLHLLFSDSLQANIPDTLFWQQVEDVNGLSIPDGYINFQLDTKAPAVQSISSTYFNEITVTFSEPVIESAASALNHYNLLTVGNPTNIEILNETSCLLSFEDTLSNNSNYELIVSRIADYSGNLLTDTVSFLFEAPFIPSYGDLVITEIMADPDPVVGLASAEYVELFNNSSQPINLRQVFVSDDSGIINLPDTILAPATYGLIVDDSDAPNFNTGTVIAVNSLFSLGNNEDSLTVSITNEILDAIAYTDDWYNDNTKVNGGYSLERISINPICEDEENWSVSLDPNGGTPGEENSIFNNSPDSVPPYVTNLDISPTQLIVYFSEPVDTSSVQLSDFTLVPAINNLSVHFDSVIVALTDELDSATIYNITIANIFDCAGNELTSFTGFFGIGKRPEPGELLFTEIMADPTPVVALPDAEYVELYNHSNNLLNLSGIMFGDASISIPLSNYLLEPQQYLVITSSANQLQFDSVNVLGLSNFASLTNSGDSIGLSNGETQLDAVTYDRSWYRDADKDDGGYSLERISFDDQCDPSSNWAASDSSAGGTPGYQNSIFNQNPDINAPNVEGISLISSDSIVLTFNESMDTVSEVLTKINFDPLVTIHSSHWTNFMELLIVMSEPLDEGILYEIQISEINDCAGNAMSSFNTIIGIGQSPSVGDLIINEIFADPTPVVGLPEAEYIEIYNRSDKLIKLDGLTIEDFSGSAVVSNGFLAPQSYLVLTNASSLFRFEGIENTVGINGFPSLGNNGDLIKLSINEITIDSIQFERDWYGNTDMDDGGYSLELINPDASCSGPNNWTVSSSDAGGTPGLQNSVFSPLPDTISPLITTFSFTENQITINFNEWMDTLSLTEGTYIFNPNIEVTNIGASLDGVELIFATQMEIGTLYEFTISNITDCSGNVITPTTLEIGVGSTPSYHDLLITEIMADPEPPNDLPNTEYLEIYNASTELIDLSGINVSDKTETTSINGGILKSGEYAVLTPNAAINLFDSNIKVIGIANWPSLGNSGDDLSLSIGGEEIISLSYQENWYDDPTIDGGISLEMIDVSNPCGENDNWTASVSTTGGTPGRVNASSASNPDLFGPNLLSAYAISQQQVELSFDEKIGSNLTNAFVTIEPVVPISDIQLAGNSDKLLLLSLQETLAPNTNYHLIIQEVSDCLNNPIQSNEASFVLPENADSLEIVINEILFNPRSTGVDFVEILNPTTKYFNLKNWRIANHSYFNSGSSELVTDANLIIGPDELLVFTTDKESILNEYPLSIENHIFQVDQLPTFANDEGTVILIDSLGHTIDLVDYSEDFHYDLLDDVDGVSLERIDPFGSSVDGNNWKSASSTSGFATPGYENSQSFNTMEVDKIISVDPQVFTPGDETSGVPSFTTIKYDFESPGYFANVNIYNTAGQLVKSLANGELLPTSGFLRWDGTRNNGAMADVGYYIIKFEIYNNLGDQRSFQKTVVVGRKF